MSHDDPGIKAVRNQSGYDVGYTAICRRCIAPDEHWYGELRDTYGLASLDLWEHVKTKETTA